MQRRAARRAAKDGKPAPTLTSWDSLLGVHDTTRLGALRFRRGADRPFLDDSADLAAPPIARVPALQAISLKLEDAHAEEHPDYDEWLAQLVAPGSSLGGARPKAAVIDESGRLCIAKFPSRRTRTMSAPGRVSSIGLPQARASRCPQRHCTGSVAKAIPTSAAASIAPRPADGELSCPR